MARARAAVSDLEGRDGAVSRRQQRDWNGGYRLGRRALVVSESLAVGDCSLCAAAVLVVCEGRRSQRRICGGRWVGGRARAAQTAVSGYSLSGLPRPLASRVIGNVGDSHDPLGTVRLALRGLLLLRAVRRHVALLLSPGLMFVLAVAAVDHRVLLSKEEEARVRPGPPSILAETNRTFGAARRPGACRGCMCVG